MKGNPKQDDPLIQNLHDAGCSQQIIEQFMQSRKEGNIFCQIHILVKQRNLLLEDLHKDQNKLDCLDYLLFQLKSGICFLKTSIRIRTSWIALITFFFN